jgi:hypothetical protein
MVAIVAMAVLAIAVVIAVTSSRRPVIGEVQETAMPPSATAPAKKTTTQRDIPQPTRRDHGGHNPLERVTVNLIARASQALQNASDLTGDSKTDTINRAIQVYAYLEEVISRGGAIYVRESEDSELLLLKMF